MMRNKSRIAINTAKIKTTRAMIIGNIPKLPALAGALLAGFAFVGGACGLFPGMCILCFCTCAPEGEGVVFFAGEDMGGGRKAGLGAVDVCACICGRGLITWVWCKLISCAAIWFCAEVVLLLTAPRSGALFKLFKDEPQPGQKVACGTKVAPQREHVAACAGLEAGCAGTLETVAGTG